MNIFQDILPYGVFGKSRAINAENPTGEKGKGGMASSNLGKGRPGDVEILSIAIEGRKMAEVKCNKMSV